MQAYQVQLQEPASVVTGKPVYRTYDQVRRAVDLTVATVGLLFGLPVMALIALAVKLDSPGPVFYGQDRVGRNRRRLQRSMRLFGNVFRIDLRRTDESGKVFRMYKFRTMRQDAEAKTGPVWATANDPRVTRVGRLLRKTRLDELPQLWNVFKGEMTLIGPRPERPEFVRQFSVAIPGYSDRHWVTPGITGLSQIRQGYDRCLDDVRRKVGHDLEYIRNRSPRLDLYILWCTVSVVFTGRGAH